MPLKLSIVLSTQPTFFSALTYKGELKKNIARIRDQGYDGVELAIREPKLLQVNEIKSLFADNNLVVPAIGTGQAYGEEGLSFTHPEQNIREKAVARIISHVALAGQLDAVVIIGLIRGQNAGKIAVRQAEYWLADALIECSSVNQQVRIAIEPINRYETDLLNTVSSGMQFLDRLKLDNVGLLLDSFHMNIEEPSIIKAIEITKDRLFHFHIADSNRWYPGAGHINFHDIIETLKKIKYRGFLSAEILPLPDPDTAAVKTIEYMRKLL